MLDQGVVSRFLRSVAEFEGAAGTTWQDQVFRVFDNLLANELVDTDYTQTTRTDVERQLWLGCHNRPYYVCEIFEGLLGWSGLVDSIHPKLRAIFPVVTTYEFLNGRHQSHSVFCYGSKQSPVLFALVVVYGSTTVSIKTIAFYTDAAADLISVGLEHARDTGEDYTWLDMFRGGFEKVLQAFDGRIPDSDRVVTGIHPGNVDFRYWKSVVTWFYPRAQEISDVPPTLRSAIASQLAEWQRNKSMHDRLTADIYDLDNLHGVWKIGQPVYAWCARGKRGSRHMYACGIVRDMTGWEQERRMAFALGTSEKAGADSHVSLLLPELVRTILNSDDRRL